MPDCELRLGKELTRLLDFDHLRLDLGRALLLFVVRVEQLHVAVDLLALHLAIDLSLRRRVRLTMLTRVGDLGVATMIAVEGQRHADTIGAIGTATARTCDFSSKTKLKI